MRRFLLAPVLSIAITASCAHEAARDRPVAPGEAFEAAGAAGAAELGADRALIVAGARSAAGDVDRLEHSLRTTFGVGTIRVLAPGSSAAELLDRTGDEAGEIHGGGRLWLGFVGEVVEGEGALPALRLGGDETLGIADWLGAAASDQGDAVLLIDGVTEVESLHFELLTFEVPNVAVLAGLRAPHAVGITFEEALARTREGGPMVDANSDQRINGIEAMRYLRFVGEPPLHVQFAARGAALSDSAPLFGERDR